MNIPPPPAKRGQSRSRNAITPQEVEQIIELKLQYMSRDNIAKTVGVSTKTVDKYWFRYKKEMAEERLNNTEMAYMEVIARLQKNAKDCRKGYLEADQAGDQRTAAQFLEKEQKALDMLIKYGPERDDEPERARRIMEAQLTPVLMALDAAFQIAGITAEQEKQIKEYIVGEVIPKQIEA